MGTQGQAVDNRPARAYLGEAIGCGKRRKREQDRESRHKFEIGVKLQMEYAGTPGEGLAALAEYYRAGGQLLARKLFGFHGRKAPGYEEFLRTRGGLLYYHLDALGTVQALTVR